MTNINDIHYDSELAIDRVTIAGKPIPIVPEPSTLVLMGLGLGAFVLGRRRNGAVSVAMTAITGPAR